MVSRQSESASNENTGEQKSEQPKTPHTEVEDRLAALEQEKAALEDQARSLQDRILRSAADFENFKRKLRAEVDEAQQLGQLQMIKQLLPVIDNLHRALEHAPADDIVAKGVRMVEQQMMGVLEQSGVKRFSAVGQPFDPNLHEAVQQEESAEVAPGTVLREYASGYMHKDRLLRAATVVVAREPQQ